MDGETKLLVAQLRVIVDRLDAISKADNRDPVEVLVSDNELESGVRKAIDGSAHVGRVKELLNEFGVERVFDLPVDKRRDFLVRLATE